jgi:hypothetical protein
MVPTVTTHTSAANIKKGSAIELKSTAISLHAWIGDKVKRGGKITCLNGCVNRGSMAQGNVISAALRKSPELRSAFI